MSVVVSFAQVSRMLATCAPGHAVRMATHSRVVTYLGKVYLRLPKFDQIELGHVRKMVRYLGIDRDCATSCIPNL